jgi:hypothetical protein
VIEVDGALAGLLVTGAVGLAAVLAPVLTRRGDRAVEKQVRLADVARKVRDERAAIYVRALAVAERIRTDVRSWEKAPKTEADAPDEAWHLLQAELGAYGSQAVFDAFDRVVQRTEELRLVLRHGETARRLVASTERDLRRPVVSAEERARQVATLLSMIRQLGSPIDDETQRRLDQLPPPGSIPVTSDERDDLRAQLVEYQNAVETSETRAGQLIASCGDGVAELRRLIRGELQLPGA